MTYRKLNDWPLEHISLHVFCILVHCVISIPPVIHLCSYNESNYNCYCKAKQMIFISFLVMFQISNMFFMSCTRTAASVAMVIYAHSPH